MPYETQPDLEKLSDELSDLEEIFWDFEGESVTSHGGEHGRVALSGEGIRQRIIQIEAIFAQAMDIENYS